MTVRDADGKKLGKVCRLDPWGFEVVRGFWGPREWVIRYAEVLGVEGGAVRVARSDEALFELASGGLPHAWRRYTPPLATTPLPSAPADGEVEGALLDEPGEEAIPRRPGAPAAEPVSGEHKIPGDYAAAAHGSFAAAKVGYHFRKVAGSSSLMTGSQATGGEPARGHPAQDIRSAASSTSRSG